ncbi:MAG: discoidin domain-containing protein, partial [Clostridia bacterium]|nr:discoidin domain-containing protein [Clostridia bacterium]
ITDGVKDNSNYYWEGGKSPSYFIVDLGAKYNLSYFRIYNYWKDGRSYDYNIYTSLTGSSYSLVYQQSSVKATSSGTRFNLSEEITARYIKVEMPNGNSQNTYCHCVEFEAYGYIPDESACMVTYSGTVSEGGTVNTTANGVNGTVPADGSADITVTNTKYPFSVTFPIRKTALDNEGEKTFSFAIEQVKNNTWEKISDIGGTNITVTDTETGESFVNLGYSAGTTGTFYYKVSEIKGEDSFFYDENFYIVEVSAYGSYALITGVYKNGTEVLTADDISFVNTRKTSLYVSKLVDSNDRTGEFSFSALITLDGEPVTLPEPPEGANYTVEGNVITFTLKDGEYIFIDNLPYGAKMKVEEILSEDNEFSVFYRIDGEESGLISGSSTTIELDDDTEHIHFINKAYYEIPATGGFGAAPYTAMGAILIISSFLAVFYCRRKREVCCP